MQAWSSLVGLQFENLVLNNVDVLLAHMGLSNSTIINAGSFLQSQTKTHKGCQIDLMLRSKESLYIFEVKFRNRITSSVVKALHEKVIRLKLPRSVSVRYGLIYQGKLDASLENNDAIDFCIPFERLLQKP